MHQVRRGRNTTAALSLLMQQCGRPLINESTLKPTQVLSKNDAVDEINRVELSIIESPTREFKATDRVIPAALEPLYDVKTPEERKAKVQEQKILLEKHSYFKNHLASETIELKKGAQVMLLCNLRLHGDTDKMLVNGSRGVVCSIATRKTSLERLQAELDGARNPVEKLKLSKHLFNLNNSDQKTVPCVLFRNKGKHQHLAVSSYLSFTFTFTVKRYIYPETFTHEIPKVGQCERVQTPLKLAWAIR